MDRVCSRCGCSSFHYNRSRMRMECDSCGHPIPDPQQDQQLMEYDRAYSQAIRHLTAGNWKQATDLLRPLVSQHPTEKKLYLALLRAATKDFRDIDMANTSSRSAASEAWDKLIRLNGVTGEMLRYSRQRYERHREELRQQRAKILAWIFAAALSSVLIGVFWEMEDSGLSLLCTGCLVCCLYKVVNSHPVMVIRQLTSAVPNYHDNPFI